MKHSGDKYIVEIAGKRRGGVASIHWYDEETGKVVTVHSSKRGGWGVWAK